LLNADKHKNHEAGRRMSTKYLVVVAALAAMLIASTALATADNALADKKRKSHEKNQVTTQVNDCGNGPPRDGDDLTTEPMGPIDVFCQNLASQIQGDNNAAALEGEQGSD
jgi:hypothetical protein